MRKNRNAWAPDLRKKGPHWLKLELAKVSTVSQIHVTFEKGSVDCTVEMLVGDKWTSAASIKPGDQRRHVLNIKPVETSAIRLVLPGKAKFGICEVRAYK